MNYHFINRSFFLVILVLLNSLSTINAQSSVFFMEFRGRAVFERTPLSGAKVTVYQNEKKMKQIITDKKGNIAFDLPFNAEYKITFEKKGYVNMHLLINSMVPKGKDNQFYGYTTDFPFFKTDDESFDTKKFNYPFTKIAYDAKKKNIADDINYMSDFTNGILKEMQAD